MAEKQGYDESDDGRRLIVGNLPPNCEEEFLENYFESRKHFWDGIVVEDIHFEEEEAIITFEKATDVDQILQRHERDPCVLGKKQLTIKPLKSYDDATDASSFVVLDDDTITNTTGDSQFSSLQQYGSLLSLNSMSSVTSVASVDSNALFGSGGSRSRSFSKEFVEFHLIYLQEKRVLRVSETDLSPVIVSYAATTCSADKSMNVSHRTRQLTFGNAHGKSQTLLQETLSTQFEGKIDIKTEKSAIIVTLTENVKNINNVDGFQQAFLTTLKSFEEIVVVQLHELNAERFDLALKHFLTLLRKNPTIKMYRTDDEFSFYIAFQTEEDKNQVNVHMKIVRDQPIRKTVEPLQTADYFKIQAYRQMLDSQNAMITVEENRIVIEAFEEDITTTICAINKILYTCYCVAKRLDEFAVNRLNDTNIAKELKQLLSDARLKVWWKVSGHFLNVVGKNEKEANKAGELIVAFFSMRRIDFPDYLLDSPLWEKTKHLAVLTYQGRLYVDDKKERPVVIIKGTTDVCKTFAEITEDFKRANTRITKTKQLTEAKCVFILKCMKEEVENVEEAEYLKLQQGNDKTEITVEGTEVAQDKFESRLKEISTQKFWVGNEKVVDRLTTISEAKKSKLTGTLMVYENKTQIILKNGKIEEEQVDVVVNSASEDLNLRTGDNTITHAISDAAGEQAQKSLEHYKRPIPVGSVIVGDAGNMKCKALFHAVLVRFNAKEKGTSIETLKKVMTICLDQAAKRGYTSIAFPALCTGVHEYPVKTVAETMLDSITEYCCQNETSSLKNIFIVLLNEGKKKIKIFQDCKKQRQENLEKMKTRKVLWNTVPWPSRFFCHITASTHTIATELSVRINDELMDQEQTYRKDLLQTE